MTLQPLDILLYKVAPGAPLMGRLIGWIERKAGEQKGVSAYYHVAFCSRDPTRIFSSQPPKIGLYDAPAIGEPYLEIYRLLQMPPRDVLTSILAYADSRRGRWYDFLGVMTFGMIELGGLELCSKFTLDSFAAGGLLLSPDVQFPTPDDIAASQLLKRLA